jgi:rfaE bifunctional protein kinase chain/domain
MKKKIKVFVSGVFNVLHPGHLRLLRFAREYGTELFVGVLSDKLANNSAHVNEDLRLEGIKTNGWVSKAIIVKDSLKKEILKYKPDIIVKGKEHETSFNEEAAVIKTLGGSLLFSSGEATFSSIDLINKEFKSSGYQQIQLSESYLKRHKIFKKKLLNTVSSLNKIKVCVIGDLIIDEYISCNALGMSQEEPTLVVTPIDSKKFVGGAGIVAAHAAGCGANVKLISVVGKDELAVYADQSLKMMGVESFFFEDERRPTTLKQRYRSGGKSLLRISKLHQDPVSSAIEKKIFTKIKKILKKSDLLIFSDFNYGCLTDSLVEKITKLCKKNNIFIAADCQSSSQIGDISKFKNVDLMTPTEREARICTHNHSQALHILANNLQKKSNAKNLIIKLGGEGIFIRPEKKYKKNSLKEDKIEAMNLSAKDTAGAGDSLLTVTSMSLATGASIWESSFLGSLAAAIQVGTVGNKVIKKKDLIRELEK